ncbi:MAG TPA: S53 family peptidase [Solirubrobacteraceae bacterium]|jgi:subtilase family serine protease|nr:S53 family peptidase [Solirubrobacteraceae bacterium]
MGSSLFGQRSAVLNAGRVVLLAGLILALLGAASASARTTKRAHRTSRHHRTATARATRARRISPLAAEVPLSAFTKHQDSATACTLPDGSTVNYFHCYTPQDIRSFYGVDRVAPLAPDVPNYGQGQTIVLVDSYGSPTAASDLQTFHNTFFSNLPNPSFKQVFPQGNPQYKDACKNSKGLSGPCSAANWSGEATLDIEWAYSIAPEAHLVLVAVPPAETLGVQGFPNLFNAISKEIDATPAGTMFSMSFGAAEQNFGGAAASQTAKFDKVFKKGLAKDDNFFAASGDYGTYNASKQHKDTTNFQYPTVGWPASSPYVVSVGGTQVQDGWTWAPTSNDAFTSTGAYNPDYWSSTSGGSSQAVWNESWAPIATGGGASAVYARPSWQSGVDPGYGNHRLAPDTAWNAAVNGGVDVYITAYPGFNCGNTTGCWTFFGGTSAATPQTAALTALANAARAHETPSKGPIGFLDPILYGGVGTSAYSDIVPQHYGSAPATFAGSEVGVSGPVYKSVGDLRDNQLWGVPVAGYPTTTGYDATTGWGTPNAPAFVAALAGR